MCENYSQILTYVIQKLYEERRGFLDFVDTLNVAYLRNTNVNQIVSFDGDYDQFSGEGIVRIY